MNDDGNASGNLAVNIAVVFSCSVVILVPCKNRREKVKQIKTKKDEKQIFIMGVL